VGIILPHVSVEPLGRRSGAAIIMALTKGNGGDGRGVGSNVFTKERTVYNSAFFYFWGGEMNAFLFFVASAVLDRIRRVRPNMIAAWGLFPLTVTPEGRGTIGIENELLIRETRPTRPIARIKSAHALKITNAQTSRPH